MKHLPSRRLISPHNRIGAALGVAMIFTVILSMMVASTLYWADQNKRNDAQRFLLQYASNACQSILSYQAAWIKQNNYSPRESGPIPIEGYLSNFISSAFPYVDLNESELYLTKASESIWVYVDPDNPMNRNSIFTGQKVLQEVIGILVKVVVHSPAVSQPITLCAGLPIINTFFPYFQPIVFFDMDAEYYTNNQHGMNNVKYMTYSNGTAWSTGNAYFANLIVANKGFRQTIPSLASSPEELSQILTKSFVYNGAWVGSTRFMGKNKNQVYNSLQSPQWGGAGDHNESLYYNSLSQDVNLDTSYPHSWEEFINTYAIWFAGKHEGFPIPGFKHYLQSDPPVNTDSPQKNSKSYAWALLEPPLDPSSAWSKKDGEFYKFSRNACLIIRPDYFATQGSTDTGRPENTDLQSGKPIIGTIGTPPNSTWGMPRFPSTPYPAQASQMMRPIEMGSTYYNVYLFQYSSSDNYTQLKNFGDYNYRIPDDPSFSITDKPSTFYAWQVPFTAPFLGMSLPNFPTSQYGDNLYASFFDSRRNRYIDALIIDVQKLYDFLRNGDPLCPSYQPNRDYTGIVYIWWPEGNASVDYQGNIQDDKLITPWDDNQAGSFPMEKNFGAVLINGGSIPRSDDPAGGFTIVTNAPLYVAGNYGSGAWPCMLAADAITLLSDNFLHPVEGGGPFLYTTDYQNGTDRTIAATHMVSANYTLNTSLMGGITMYGLTGQAQDRGDGVFNTPRTIENFAGTNTGHGTSGDASSLVINGTIFGLFEPQVALGRIGGAAPNLNPAMYINPCVINPNHATTPPPPPGCEFLKCNQYRMGHFEYITSDQYDSFTQ